MWIVKPEEDRQIQHRKRLMSVLVVHLDTILRGTHLITSPIYQLDPTKILINEMLNVLANADFPFIYSTCSFFMTG